MDRKVVKVLVITKKNSGAHYHRLEYPFKKINGSKLDEVEFNITFTLFLEDTFKKCFDYDIVIYHWDVPMNITQIGELQTKGVRIIYSLDDYFHFSEFHPYINTDFQRKHVANVVKKHLLNADVVITTTPQLAINCLEYNDNVAVLPNFIDSADFTFKEKVKSDKLRVGIIGSLSNCPNYMLLKGVINRIAANKELASKCEFYICGIEKGNPDWDRVIKMFTVKKNLTVHVREFLPLETYLDGYSELDVCLIPLEDTEFNRCKSALHLQECAITNTLPVGSSFYALKELKGIVVCEEAMQYEQTLIKLLDKDYYNNLLKYITDINLKDADFEKRFQDTKVVLKATIEEDMSTKLDNVNITQIVYNENQPVEYNKYDNSFRNKLEHKTWGFEYNVFLDICKQDLKEDYIGIFSWKFSKKTGFTKNILYKTLKHYKYENYDFINLSRNYWKNGREYLQFSEEQHPGLLERLEEVCNAVNLKVYSNPTTVNYSNFYLMKKEYFQDYANNYVIPALEYMETKPERFMVDAQYQGGLSSEKLKEVSELDFYTFHTFILERLILMYLENKNLKVLNLI